MGHAGNWSGWRRARTSPALLVGLVLSIFGIVWLAHLSYTSLSPPTDNIEQLTCAGSLEAGYYKHPPLPTWLFWLSTKLFGTTAWTSYVVGAVCTLGTMALLWRLLLELRGWRYATLALLAALCITYVSLLTGADLQLQWGTPFLLFAVPAAMELSGRWITWSQRSLRPALKAFVVMQTVLLLLSHLTSARGPLSLQYHHWRGFDGAALARAIAPTARKALGGSICSVSGPAAMAGALSLELPERPGVLIDGRYDRSPWIDKRVIDECGAVELGDSKSLVGGAAVGSAFPGLSWRVRPGSRAWDANTTAMHSAR